MPDATTRSIRSPVLRPRPRPDGPAPAWVLIAAAVFAVSGCSKSSSPTQPALHPVAGNVAITGALRDTAGLITGARTVDSADGIRVYLWSSAGLMDSALTVGGNYRMDARVPDLSGPGYVAGARLGPSLAAWTAPFHADGRNVAFAPQLKLSSVGSLDVAPSPFTDRLRVKFTLAANGSVGLGVFDLASLRVATLVAGPLAKGKHAVEWDGTDGAGHAVPDGAYWIVFSGDGRQWAELVFKGP